MRRQRPPVPIAATLARRSEDYWRHLLTGQYRELANECRELLHLAADANPPAPRLTRCLGALEDSAGRPAPHGVLIGWQVLERARRERCRKLGGIAEGEARNALSASSLVSRKIPGRNCL